MHLYVAISQINDSRGFLSVATPGAIPQILSDTHLSALREKACLEQGHVSQWPSAKAEAIKKDIDGINPGQNSGKKEAGEPYSSDAAIRQQAQQLHGLPQTQSTIAQRSASLKLHSNAAPLPASPFTTAPMGKLQLGAKEEAEANAANLHDSSPYTPSNQSKLPWSESPRQSYSEGENLTAQVTSFAF